MSNSEILEHIRGLHLVIENALKEAGTGTNIEFYKALLQQNAISIYQQAAMLDTKGGSTKAPEIKIIRHEQIVNTEEPAVVKEEKKPEPVVVNESKPEPVPVPPPVEQVAKKQAEPVTPPVTPPVSQPKSRPIQADEEEDTSLNAKLSKNKQPVLNISEKSKETPIKDLVKAISIGKKFEFINDLFDGDSEAYKSCIQSIQQFSSYEEAASFLEKNIIGPYNWGENEMLAAEFFSLVKRRFL